MDISPTLQFIVLVGAVVGVLAGLFRWLRPKYRRTRRELIAAKDSLLGREPRYDSITGQEIAPALPGIGQRMATIETALGQLVNLHERLDTHDKRISILEDKDVERALARTESIEMLRTIDTAIRSDPRGPRDRDQRD